MRGNKRPAHKRRADNIENLINNRGEINENVMCDMLGIAPRTWKAERQYFLDTHPGFGYDEKHRRLFKRIILPTQLTLTDPSIESPKALELK